ncbi:MAG TPA: GGDEF domain-containing protein [Candidatus Tectomicrobia bacterium]|nr:GGDEF domain-containing protein [Candidatus Tectomicrobia bacterium]
MDFVDALARSLARLAGLAKAVENPILRDQLEAEIATFQAHLAGLRATLGQMESERRSLRTARRDEVTDLPDGRYLVERLGEEFRRSVRYQTALSVMLAALDDYQAVKARRGRLVADDLLRRAAHTIKRSTRETDIVVREGPDTFAILLPHSDHEAARRLGARLAVAVGALPGSPTLDVGIATVTASTEGPMALLRMAERALTRARLLRTEETRGRATWIPGELSRE